MENSQTNLFCEPSIALAHPSAPSCSEGIYYGKLKFTYQNNKRFRKIKISSSRDIFSFLKSIWPFDIEVRERFYVLFLDRSNCVIGYEELSSGGVTGTIVDPKLIFQKALLTPGMTSVVLSHNHPSGNLNPSREDIAITEKIKSGCILLDIVLMDHFIITKNSYYGFADAGAL